MKAPTTSLKGLSSFPSACLSRNVSSIKDLTDLQSCMLNLINRSLYVFCFIIIPYRVFLNSIPTTQVNRKLFRDNSLAFEWILVLAGPTISSLFIGDKNYTCLSRFRLKKTWFEFRLLRNEIYKYLVYFCVPLSARLFQSVQCFLQFAYPVALFQYLGFCTHRHLRVPADIPAQLSTISAAS